MFWYCDVVQQFWTDLMKLMNEKCNNVFDINLTPLLILFGCDKAIYTDNVFDFIILFAKWYIYGCRIDGTLPQLLVFTRKLKSRFKIEEHNARANLDHLNFSIKWANYKPIFDI